jgi:hypothetical protein
MYLMAGEDLNLGELGSTFPCSVAGTKARREVLELTWSQLVAGFAITSSASHCHRDTSVLLCQPIRHNKAVYILTLLTYAHGHGILMELSTDAMYLPFYRRQDTRQINITLERTICSSTRG